MFIKEIQLENYKCFEKQAFKFEKQFTTIIGDNGSGKTALLDGVTRALNGLVSYLSPHPDTNSMKFKEDEIRIVFNKIGSKFSKETQRYGLKCVLFNGIAWEFSPNRDTWRKREKALLDYAIHLREDFSIDVPPNLPIIAYYRTNRHWGSEQHKDVDLFSLGSRFKTYETCLNISTSFKTVLGWFKRMALISFQKKKNIPELIAVKKAMIQAIEGLHPDKNIEIYFSAENDELMVDIGNGKEFPIRMLSDGYRNTLGMIADIAYRMAELNPHLTTDSPGIVLIDELDLHLHPKWQRHIVGDLKRIFPNCQFIVTTHSPFIIQSLKSGELLKLDETPELEYEDFTTKSIEDIAEDEQGVTMPQRSIYLQEKYDAAKTYYQKLETMNGNMTKEQKKQLREELALLTERYADDVAYLAFLEQKRLVKEAQIQK